MNKVEEFLLEEAVDDLVMGCDSKGEYVYASDMMQKYADQQCDIQRVSQQRELLIDFLEINNWLSLEDEENAKGVVDVYLNNL
jgi:hypothetical protein